MKLVVAIKVLAVCALIYWPTASFSHISLENKSAVAGSVYKAVFQVSHGCGDSPTTALVVQIPQGFQSAKPFAKAGWTIAQQGNTSVTWTATTKEAALPPAHLDEFMLRGKLPETAGPMWFKVLRTCESGSNNWSEVPAAGTSTQGMKSPAALLEVTTAGKPASMGTTEHKH